MIIGIKAKRLLLLLMAGVLAVTVLFARAEKNDETKAETVVLKEKDKSVLVIDPGHGGEDGGAQSADGLIESGVNLDISLRMDAICKLMGIQTVLTRESSDINYPDDARTTAARKKYDQNQRLELINSIPTAVMVSIHQNKFPDSRPKGSQVLYSAADGSKELGEIMQANLVSGIYPENRRVAAPISKKIYLTRMAKCPAVLVECAFLSNPEEAALLRTDKYKISLAVVILGSYMQYDKGIF